jgi:hypothetical protein
VPLAGRRLFKLTRIRATELPEEGDMPWVATATGSTAPDSPIDADTEMSDQLNGQMVSLAYLSQLLSALGRRFF